MAGKQRRRRDTRRRHHARRTRDALAGAGLATGAFLGLSAPALAEDFVVTNLNDGPGGGPPGSLRKAIADANALEGEDRILFQSTLAGSIWLSEGQLTITDPLEVEGPGAYIYGPGATQIQVSGGQDTRLFHVDGVDATISGLILTGGNAPTGAAIESTGDELVVADSLITGNRATAGDGGAVVSSGSVRVYDSTLYGNRATGRGGALSSDGELTIVSSTISGNAAGGNGGGAFAGDGTWIYGSTISANVSAGIGGGVYAEPESFFGEPSYIADSTIYKNTAFGGGGLVVDGTADVMNSIIAGNAGSRPERGPDDLGGTIFTAFSVVGNEVTEEVGPTVITADPRLGPLGDNGGTTLTHRPRPDSPAVDRGLAVDSLDQRGESRPVDIPWVANAAGGDGSDIGAFELRQSEGPAAPAPPAQSKSKKKKKAKCKKAKRRSFAAAKKCKKRVKR